MSPDGCSFSKLWCNLVVTVTTMSAALYRLSVGLICSFVSPPTQNAGVETRLNRIDARYFSVSDSLSRASILQGPGRPAQHFAEGAHIQTYAYVVGPQ